ncbi:Gfo/Idh/MocA family oxidoreductase [Dactylosporangium roseum]|uniref:Gfo/Idh/MocA family protein n=1 Tax=Dactylosporangium roseum TaxID=47989 RepID=UPI0031D69BD8
MNSPDVAARRPLGVGLVGAGLATQSIHLPTLAGLADELRVVHVMDVLDDQAVAVAARVGARAGTSIEELLDDPAVDIVGVCSPHQFHAEHVIGACAAGKRAVFCEKPLTLTRNEAAEIQLASERFGVPVFVGTMNLWDPAASAALAACGALRTEASMIRSTILIPPNESLIDLATDRIDRPMWLPPAPADMSPVQAAQYQLGRTILGLAVHGLALVRRFMPVVHEVTFARTIEPWGYVLSLTDGSRVARLMGMLGGSWDPEWTFTAIGPRSELRIDFPPSYVLAGSATATVRHGAEQRTWRFGHGGFHAQWRHLADVARGHVAPRVSVAEAVQDVVYALDVVTAAQARLVDEVSSEC